MRLLQVTVYFDAYCQTGFNRYKQLLSIFAGNWLKINLFTIAGVMPLAAGIVFSILSSSVLVLLPCSIASGMIFGPFLVGMYDAVLRGLRDTPENWWAAYKDSLLPGALVGLLAGMYAFMAGLMWWAQVSPSPGTIVLYLFAGLLFLLLNTLYWPRMVLFRQTTGNRFRNIILFTAKYFWRAFGVILLQLAYILIYVFFAPWTLFLLPILGVWYIVFLSMFFLYTPLNQELQIEARLTGRPVSDDESHQI